jgi:hypothetical protein
MIAESEKPRRAGQAAPQGDERRQLACPAALEMQVPIRPLPVDGLRIRCKGDIARWLAAHLPFGV